MIDKLLIFPGRTDKGIFTFVIDTEQSYLEKTAAQYNPVIAAYIHNAKPIPGKTQILLTALGAGEYWGCNVNGDYFPEAALAHPGETYGHKTFERYAKAYKHHINKDPSKNYGDVALSVYNPVYHRVELIVIIDNARAPDIAAQMESGDYPEWSMGCKVPFDVCSICHNKAPTRKQYCDHARYMLGQIDPETGKQVYVINYNPRFHDISKVLIGADRIAKTLMKVASATTVSSGGIHLIGSAALAEKVAERSKTAVISKKIPTDAPPASEESLDNIAKNIPEVKASERTLPTDVLDRLSSHTLPSSMSTMASMGILPKPQEFQRIFLRQLGKPGLADVLDRHRMCFDPCMSSEPEARHEKALDLNHRNFNPRIMDILKPFMADRSYAAPHLARRMIIMVKTAEKLEEDLPIFIKSAEDISRLDWEKMNAPDLDKERKPLGLLPMLMAAAGLYAAFGKKAPDEAVKGIDSLIQKNPGLAAALGVGLASTFGAMAGPTRKGQFSHGSYVNPDASDGKGFVRRHSEKPLAKTGGMAEMGRRTGASFKRLFVGIPAVYLASGILQKHKELNPYGGQPGGAKNFLRRNPDVVSGALIADALLASRGKGSYGVARKLSPKLKTLMGGLKTKFGPNPIPKTAAATDFLAEVARGTSFPLAVGGANLPGRMVGGLFDQAVLNLAQRMTEKKRTKQSQAMLPKAASIFYKS